jgi:hypothetical protein
LSLLFLLFPSSRTLTNSLLEQARTLDTLTIKALQSQVEALNLDRENANRVKAQEGALQVAKVAAQQRRTEADAHAYATIANAKVHSTSLVPSFTLHRDADTLSPLSTCRLPPKPSRLTPALAPTPSGSKPKPIHKLPMPELVKFSSRGLRCVVVFLFPSFPFTSSSNRSWNVLPLTGLSRQGVR